MDVTPASNVVDQNNLQAHHAHKSLLEGIHFKYPTFKHDHPPVIDVNEVADERMTIGQRIADGVATTMGSWRFIIIQTVIVGIWITSNVWLLAHPFDPYPLILLNLLFSTQAAYAAPVIMMSQNRQAAKDRLTAESDYRTNVKGEEEIRFIMEHLDHQDTVLLQLVKRIEEQHLEIKEHLVRLDPTLAERLGADIVKMSQKSLTENEDEVGNS
ncbi:MAG TPA: DUF1003 domain-containing protein [Ktedonobacteraceae bacterium]|nr:DUF1003 domain-containing protein [Ktedonobacteraceae bacterium]